MSLAALAGMAIFLSGAIAGINEWQRNSQLLKTGTLVPAEVYESVYGSNVDLKLVFEVDGEQYRRTIRSGVFKRLRGQSQGTVLWILVDPAAPDHIRFPDYASYTHCARMRILTLPFLIVLLGRARGSLHVVANLAESRWYAGSFEVHKTKGSWWKRTPTLYRATLWGAAGAKLRSGRAMQGAFRRDRPQAPAYFAPVGKHVLILQHGDNEGVLMTGRRELVLTQQQPIDLVG